MSNLLPANRLIDILRHYYRNEHSYATVRITCGMCASSVTDPYSWEVDTTEEEVLAAMEFGTFDYDLFFGSILCPRCKESIKEERCLRQHPIDNHLCMVYAGHEADGIDHECCRKHMFY